MAGDALEFGVRAPAGRLPRVGVGLASIRQDPRVWDALVVLLLRIGAGWVFMFHGAGKLLLGLLSPLVGLALVGDMIVAWIINFKIGLPTPANPKLAGADGYQVNIALASVALTIAVMGPGRVSLDHLLGLAGRRPLER